MNKQNKGTSDVINSYKEYTSRIKSEKIPAYEPSMGRDEIEILTKVIKNNWLSEGKYTREFESKISKICKRKFGIAFSNATSALIVGMKCLGIGRSDEIIVPSLSHSADPNSISSVGAIPVFADIDKKTLCLSVDNVKAVKTSKTKAILYVCAYGNASELDKIWQYARKNRLKLICDAAPALFGSYKGKPIASYGDFSVLSFFADKTITTGEGGMLLSDSKNFINECNIYKHDGRKERGTDIIERKGYNFRITELQSAIGVAQIKKATHFVKRKQEILHKYENALSKISQVQVFQFSSEIVPHRVIIFVPRAQTLIKYLSLRGIGARTLFMPMHSQPAYNVRKAFPKTEAVYKTGVCLPSAPTISEKQLEYVIGSIKRFYNEN